MVGDVVEAVAQLRAGVDAVLAADVESLYGAAIAAVLADVEVERRRLDAADVRLVATVEDRRRDGDFAAATVVDLLTNRLRIDVREATRRAGRAAELHRRQSLTGELLPPLLPVTSAALAAGAISGSHADVVARYTSKIDDLPDVSPETTAVAEQLLVAASEHDYPKLVARLGESLIARLDPDGSAPKDAELDRERSYSLVKNPDGSSLARGLLTPEATAAWEALFDALAAPASDEDGTPDPRTAAQRRHDAMLDVAKRLLRGDVAPAGGTPLTMLLRFSANQLPTSMLDAAAIEWEGRPTRNSARSDASSAETPGLAGLEGTHDLSCSGIGSTAHGGMVSLARLGTELCETEIAATLIDDFGGVLAFGRSRRLATRSQRLALAARDGGCSFPGCTRPAAWTEAHHVIPWWRGGRTDLSNLCLVCSFHHRHFERLGWDVIMCNGVPQWIPPPWIDPQRRPRRNTAHRLPDYDFVPG